MESTIDVTPLLAISNLFIMLVVLVTTFTTSYALMKLITLNPRIFIEIYIPSVILAFLMFTSELFSIIPDSIRFTYISIIIYTLIPIIFEIGIILFEGGVEVAYRTSKGVLTITHNIIVSATVFLFPGINKTRNTDEWMEIFNSYLFPYNYKLNKANEVSFTLKKLLSSLFDSSK